MLTAEKDHNKKAALISLIVHCDFNIQRLRKAVSRKQFFYLILHTSIIITGPGSVFSVYLVDLGLVLWWFQLF